MTVTNKCAFHPQLQVPLSSCAPESRDTLGSKRGVMPAENRLEDCVLPVVGAGLNHWQERDRPSPRPCLCLRTASSLHLLHLDEILLPDFSREL